LVKRYSGALLLAPFLVNLNANTLWRIIIEDTALSQCINQKLDAAHQIVWVHHFAPAGHTSRDVDVDRLGAGEVAVLLQPVRKELLVLLLPLFPDCPVGSEHHVGAHCVCVVKVDLPQECQLAFLQSGWMLAQM